MDTILASFNLTVTLILPTKIRVNSVHENKRKIDFQDGGHRAHFGFAIEAILTFYLQVALIFLTKFGVNWPFGLREEEQNRFLSWSSWWPSWISDLKELSYFLSTSCHDTSYRVLSQLTFWFRRKSAKRVLKKFAMGTILDFQSGKF